MVEQSISHYRIVKKLGAGGMGEVYLAEDTRLRRTVALKILAAGVASDEQQMNRFIQEARAVSALNHPNILTIHDIGHADSANFIATEFIEGETLRERMTDSSLTLHELLEVVMQVASALAAAHQANIVHRDIKPENIMVRRDGVVKVLDFGLAKLTGQDAAPISNQDAPTIAMVNTEPGVVMGTARYMSPEQARGLEVDARTDIWSLGVVIYELAAGRAPFQGATASDVIAKILEREPAQLSHTTLPVELDRIVTKALAKDPEERYQTAKDLNIDLRRLKQRLDVDAEIERTVSPEAENEQALASTHPPGSLKTEPRHTTSNTEYVVTGIRHHKVAVAMVAALLLVVAIAYYFLNFAKVSAPVIGKPAITSIAVLPFVNASKNPDAEYLSDGISESLINNLSQLPQLKVIARSSSFKFRGKEANPQEVAKALGVEAILTGRVIQLGDQLQISAELVDTRDQTQLWGEQYTRKASDLLAVQSEISREIAERLRLKLTNTEQQQLAKRSTANPAAYELLLKGRFLRNKAGGTAEGMKAVEYYTQAITVDPTYALAYAELAAAYTALGANSLFDPKEMMPKAQAAAQKALELDENLPQGHFMLAVLKKETWDWAGAEREYKRCIELNPGSAGVHSGYSTLLSVTGRHAQSLEEARLARELDPLSPGVNGRIGRVLFQAREYDQAIEQLKKALELNQNLINTHVFLGYAYAAKGQYAEAIVEYKEAIKLGEDSTSTPIYLGYALAMSGKRSEALAVRDEMQRTKKYVSPAELAILYIGLGEKEQALAALERAYAAHDLQLQFLNAEPHYDSLRSDPRFTDLVRRVGLPV
jgi:serine/threonine protein kinase/Tfp pilus assembly protein PilF